MNGNQVSDYGVKEYVDRLKTRSFSNIDPLLSLQERERKWGECDLGCHHPSYRISNRPLSYKEFIAGIGELSPVASGVVDGVYSSTIGQLKTIGAGAQRTAEGLGASGEDIFYKVGEENFTAFRFIKVNISNVVNLELDNLNNPLMRLVFTVIHKYISNIPILFIEQMIETGALCLAQSADKTFLTGVSKYLPDDSISAADISSGEQALCNAGSKYFGKKVGSKVAQGVAVAIAGKITRDIMLSAKGDFRTKKKLLTLKKTASSLKGNAANILYLLLKSNGMLGLAADESRKLQRESPLLWNYMRYNLEGLDMILFLLVDYVREYLDRIALIEKDPAMFARLMASLAAAGKTNEVFFPR